MTAVAPEGRGAGGRARRGRGRPRRGRRERLRASSSTSCCATLDTGAAVEGRHADELDRLLTLALQSGTRPCALRAGRRAGCAACLPQAAERVASSPSDARRQRGPRLAPRPPDRQALGDGGRPRGVHALRRDRRRPAAHGAARPAGDEDRERRAVTARSAQEKRYYMACLDLEGRDVLVVGAGSVALEKIEGLLEVGARVTVVAPAVSEPSRRSLATGRIALHRGVYRASDSRRQVPRRGRDLDDVRQRAGVRRRGCARDALQRRRRAGALQLHPPRRPPGRPDRRGDLHRGRVAALAQRIRDDVARSITHEHARLARELRELRPWAKSHLPTYEARRDFFRELVQERLG